ncbi:MAG: hypothetical protein ACT4PL_09080 [Phycisphaerales bacterium]|jgi:hypothetical protein|nr:MAG: hypothetical protein HRU70_11880 [Phycisphaeraceae bacterium]
MMFPRPTVLTSMLSMTAILFAGGCTTDKHTMTPAQPGQVSVCTKCYDEIAKVRGSYNPRTGQRFDHTIKTHRCDECKSDMSIYEQGGVLKVRCASCAPEGVDCDRCMPRAAK